MDEPKIKLRVAFISWEESVSCTHAQYGCDEGRATSRHIDGHVHLDPNIDGAVWYETDRVGFPHYRQPFARGGMKKHPTCKDSKGDPTNIWGWDGNKEHPTLTPSYLCSYPPGTVVHLHFTAGRIQLAGDSTVELWE